MFSFSTKQKWIISWSLFGLAVLAGIGTIFYLFDFIIVAIVLLSLAGLGFFGLMILWFIFERYNKKH
ncbi:hypothetical protein [Spiroplasma chrysopicola]|uniref:Uncharacterized protein n=1 Tax=Spiroplasma chrysopicola DF-1 TaxID=1276227 RepID=R4U1T9_9MOLU|nr:hypothetical protein [Spiroplasma chrysopicola]AGM25292.1 hypothetical protein SCHRY_v1c07160 [Spiroplasma chrysopicola DF-1]